MNDRELTNLILLPGFSTAQKVTNVSGRGVGMDVVKTNVEKIGGTLEIQSVLGRGTTLRIKIPLTLAIVPADSLSHARAIAMRFRKSACWNWYDWMAAELAVRSNLCTTCQPTVCEVACCRSSIWTKNLRPASEKVSTRAR